MMPKIPYAPRQTQVSPAPVHPVTRQSPQYTAIPIFEPPRIPTYIETVATASAPNVGQYSIPGAIPGVPNGLPGSPNVLSGEDSILAPPQSKTPRMIRRSEGVQSGMLIHRVEPLYPAIARIARVSGTVELRAIIGRDGSVGSIEVVSGNPLLVRAAVDAVRQWRYRPTILDGEAVEVETRIAVNFVLDK
ncbi:MAG TPA: energy transducer TonB [Candidatus Acidoferrales bacterium]|nr:energy transducer TonB [Candidatus Acidoferrales bacterium]